MKRFELSMGQCFISIVNLGSVSEEDLFQLGERCLAGGDEAKGFLHMVTLGKLDFGPYPCEEQYEAERHTEMLGNAIKLAEGYGLRVSGNLINRVRAQPAPVRSEFSRILVTFED